MKVQKNIEWSIVGEEVLIINPETGKVLTGNKSVASVIDYCMQHDSFDESSIVEALKSKYCISDDDFESFLVDVTYIIDYMKIEGVFIE